MAKRYGVSERIYWEIENDIRPSDLKLPSGHANDNLYALARRRHGLTLRETGALLGMSHVTLLLHEAAKNPALQAAWRRLGYRF
jgi:hypothetical protein